MLFTGGPTVIIAIQVIALNYRGTFVCFCYTVDRDGAGDVCRPSRVVRSHYRRLFLSPHPLPSKQCQSLMAKSFCYVVD